MYANIALYAFGGFEKLKYYDDIERYDIQTNKWMEIKISNSVANSFN